MSKADVLIVDQNGRRLLLKKVQKVKANAVARELNRGLLRVGLRAEVAPYGPDGKPVHQGDAK